MKRFSLLALLLTGLISFVISFVMPSDCRAEEKASFWEQFALSGWAETIQSIRTHSPHDSLTSRAKLRLELTADTEWLYAFVSADAEKNWKISSETGADFHEAWLEHAADNWDLRFGRQIIVWGKADGVQITDMISPPDYTESITRRLDEIRMPVDAAKFRLLGLWDSVDLEMIWIPVFKAAVYPRGDNPWAIATKYPDNIQVAMEPTEEPETTLANSEVAFKLSSWLSGFDIAASLFYTWDDSPTMFRTVNTVGDITAITYVPKHERLTIFGLEGAFPWKDFVFRMEAAYYRGRYYQPKMIFDQPLKKDGYRWLGGVDWSPGNDWAITAQLIGTGIIDHDKRLADVAYATTFTFNISRELLNQTLTLGNMIYWDVDEAEIYDRISAEYELTDAVHLFLGVDIFCGDDGEFGAYEENSQVWAKVKYSF